MIKLLEFIRGFLNKTLPDNFRKRLNKRLVRRLVKRLIIIKLRVYYRLRPFIGQRTLALCLSSLGHVVVIGTLLLLDKSTSVKISTISVFFEPGKVSSRLLLSVNELTPKKQIKPLFPQNIANPPPSIPPPALIMPQPKPTPQPSARTAIEPPSALKAGTKTYGPVYKEEEKIVQPVASQPSSYHRENFNSATLDTKHPSDATSQFFDGNSDAGNGRSNTAPSALSQSDNASRVPDSAITSAIKLTGNGSETKKVYLKDNYNYIDSLIRKKAVYPPQAKKLHVGGAVSIYFVIGTDGLVSDLQIRKSSGYEVLDRAAQRAVTESAPYPQPTQKTELEVSIHFTLSQ